MEDLTERSERITTAEFEELYNRAVSRLREREKRTALEEFAKQNPRKGKKGT